jgi:hypothetical protein
MSTESGDRDLDPTPGIRARWSWRRLERRAIAEHEQWVAAQLRRLAAARVPVFPATESAQAAARTAGIVRLGMRGWHLLLAGVAAGPRAELERAGRQGRLRLAAAGRYGKFWWIEIIAEGAARAEKVVLLGSHLRLTPAGRGPGWAPGPPPGGRLDLVAAT